MKRIEYVMSGTSYTRCHSNFLADNEEFKEHLNQCFHQVEKQSNHKFGALYNAFTESNFGERLKEFDAFHSIHADSGGLQIVTQGLEATDTIKDGVYKNQAQHATLGMCFDEIPVKIVSERSARNDTSGRLFDKDNFKVYAAKTGENLYKQLQVFENEGSECKPCLIAHGNCYETYVEWVDEVLKQIPQSLHSRIGGVAMAGAALGTGPLEDVQRAYAFSRLTNNFGHLHILGVGAVVRMLPYIEFVKSGLYDDDITISYDSTTHSSSVDFGMYYAHGKTNKFARTYNHTYDLMLAGIKAIAPNLNITATELFGIMNTNKTKTEAAGGDVGRFYWTKTAAICSGIVNFCQDIDRSVVSDKVLNQLIHQRKDLTPLRLLRSIRDDKDMSEWERIAAGFMTSRKIQAESPASLVDFF